jgi:hypothetical protein
MNSGEIVGIVRGPDLMVHSGYAPHGVGVLALE